MAPRTNLSPSPILCEALESAPDAMLIADVSGTIMFCSRQACELLGYAAEELEGGSLEQLIPERFRSTHPHHRARFATEQRTRPMGTGLELRALRRDGRECPVEISLSPIHHDGQRLTVMAIRDVTERRRAALELIAAREVAESARRSANEARETAERANQSKSRFLSTASHDLRQPLQSLALLNGTLRELVSEDSSLALLCRQSEAIDTMSQLLSALLELSRLESSAVKPHLEAFPAGELLLALHTEFAEAAAAKGLGLEIEPAAHLVHSDRALVEQILRHLLSNAIRYTSRGYVRLVVRTLSDRVRIDVEDTGIGIEAQELPRIYEEFYQAGGRAASAQGGSGLGLSIARRLVSLLDLQLEARSVVGQGSVFSLTLPGTESPSAPAQPTHTPPRPQPSGEAPLVLILEDDIAIQGAMELLLKVHGYRVLSAATIAQAMQLAGEHTGIELLITDYHLTCGETGVQAIGALRSRLGADLKVVLVTGDIAAALRTLEQDARVRVAGKPIRAEQLLEILQDLRRS